MEREEERVRSREAKAMVTREQAERDGLEPGAPEDRPCPHCGKLLAPLGIVIGEKVLWVASEECGCEGEAEERRLQEERERDELIQGERELLRRAGVRTRYIDATPTNEICRRYAESYVTGTGVGLYVHGPVGVGKTHNASGIAAILARKGKRVVITSALKIFSDLRETYDTRDSSRDELGKYTSCEILILDDLGKESASQWAIMTLFDIVNTRYEQMLPTIFTSQYSLKGLETRLGRARERETARAIISRIRETCLPVALAGEDRRRPPTWEGPGAMREDPSELEDILAS